MTSFEHDRPESRAFDTLCREISPAIVEDFVQGCEVLSRIIDKERPDIVFFPQRGAGPVEWTTTALMQARDKPVPHFVDLPIGTHSNVENHPKWHSGISGTEKRSIVSDVLQRLEEQGDYMPGSTKLMLVDEVQKGGTITQVAQAIRDAMNNAEDTGNLAVVAMQDSRNGLIGSDRKQSYHTLASNERKGFKVYVQPISLFTVDRVPFLDKIQRVPITEPKQVSVDDFIIVQNTAARELFSKLVQAKIFSTTAAGEVKKIADHDISGDLADTVLKTFLLDEMTRPKTTRQRSTTDQVIKWWTRYLKIT